MASTYSPNLAIELPGTGDQAGTWGNTTNTNLGTLIEQAISGYVTQAVATGTDTTITIPNGSTGVARNMYIELTGTGGTNTNLIVPSNKKLYFIYNNTSSGQVTVKVSGQTGVSVANGSKVILVSNGTDIVPAGGLTGVTATSLTALGVNAGDSVTSGTNNVAVGNNAGTAITTGSRNVVLGAGAGDLITTGAENVCIGYEAGDAIVSASQNTCVGYDALGAVTGSFNSAFGSGAALGITSGAENCLIGYATGLGITTGNENSALGATAYLSGNYSNSTCLGYGAAVTGSNQVQLGNSSTTAYAYGAVQDRSDERDKTDIRDTQLGLNFIMALRPRDFKWDMREDYRPPMPALNAPQSEWDAYQEACKLSNITHNGTHTRTRYHQGLIAQEVKQAMDAMGVDFGGYQDHTIKGGDAVLTIGYEELVAPLIKAIQELKAEFDEYKRTHP